MRTILTCIGLLAATLSFPAISGTPYARADATSKARDTTTAITSIQAWPQQKAVRIGVYREGGHHEDYVVSLDSAKTIWSRRQRTDAESRHYFAQVSPDGKEVLVFSYVRRAGGDYPRMRVCAVGVADTDSPDRVTPLWEAPDPERMIQVVATWMPGGHAILVCDIEESLFPKPDKLYVARVTAVDPALEAERDIAVHPLAQEARILGLWCPTGSPRYCIMVLNKFVAVGDANVAFKVPLDWMSGAERLGTLEGRVDEVVPSPDGTKVLVLSEETADERIGYVLRVRDGGDLRPLWELPPAIDLPFGNWFAWHPEKPRLIGFGRSPYGAPPSGIWLIDVDNKRMAPLGNISERVRRATWTPDGDSIIFATWDRVMTINVDTEEVRELWSVPSGWKGP